MGKPLTISGLSRESGVNLETIRFYERSELLPKPKRSASGYRHYEEADIRRVRFIRRGRELGFSLEDRITIIFCGSKKSLATGVPMAQVLFAGSTIGLLILPLMLFHQIQLMVCAVLAQRYAKRPESVPELMAQVDP